MQKVINFTGFDSLIEGDEFISPSRTVSESDVLQFAGLTGDLNELHTSETYAKTSLYGTRIVHGMLTLAIANGLFVRTGIVLNSVFLSIDSWKFLKPVKIGDTIRLRTIITDKRLTKSSEKGIIGMKYEVLNQENVVVSEGILHRMVDRNGESYER